MSPPSTRIPGGRKGTFRYSKSWVSRSGGVRSMHTGYASFSSVTKALAAGTSGGQPSSLFFRRRPTIRLLPIGRWLRRGTHWRSALSSLASAGEGRTNGAEDRVLRSKNRECVHPLDPAVRRPPPRPIAPEATAGRPNPRRADQSKIPRVPPEDCEPLCRLSLGQRCQCHTHLQGDA